MVGEQLSGKMGGADDDEPGGMILFMQAGVAYAVPGGIDFSDIGEVNGLGGMGGLELAERNQALPPVGVAVAEQLPGVGGLDEHGEVGEIVRRVAGNVGSLRDQ